MSTDVAIKLETIQSIRKMKEDDAGGGNVGGRNEFKKLKRKSDESIEVGGKKLKKKWNTIRRKKSNRGKKFQKKSKSPVENGGETPKLAESKKKVTTTTTTTTTTAPSAGGKRKRRMTESFNAPFNSTQFLMNDHKTEAVRHLDSTLNGGRGEGQTEVNVDDENSVDISMAERPQRRITRARESSFSIDSDEDYYYSSPEDEEEFMSREFIKDYDNLRNDRLIDMSKSELINEYLQMEERIEALEKRLSRQNSTSQTTTENDTKLEEEQENTNSKEAMADTISKFQKEIQRLESENDKLKLVQAVPPIPQQHIPPGCSSSCSSCSESDSESDSDSDSDDSSESEDDSEMEEEEKETKQVFDTILREKSRQIGEVEGDTGYESGHSNKPVTKTASISTLNNDEGIDPNDTTEDKPENTNEIESEPESCPELISVNCITSTSP